MKASIVVPVLNEEANIGRLLLSLTMLDYPRREVEIVVVDNGSTDSTREIVSRFPCRLLFESKKSGDAARNLGVTHSEGDIIAFTDGDCIVTPSWLKDLVGGFDEDRIGGVAGTIIPFATANPVERFQAWLRVPDHNPALRPYPYAVTANVAYRREVFENLGMFDDTFPGGADIDFSLRMQKLGGYSLRFLTGLGVVFHHNERNFFDLMDRAKTYGYGYYFLTKKHGSDYPGADQRLNLGHQIIPLMKRASTGVGEALRCAETPGDAFASVLSELMRILWETSLDRGIRAAHRQVSRHLPTLTDRTNFPDGLD